MTIFNLGSINNDHFFEVSHLPAPGETVASKAYFSGLGGKGANLSIAALRAGARVCHIGAVGPDGHGALAQLKSLGLSVDNISMLDVATGHAVVMIDPAGENAIVIHPGANRNIAERAVTAALVSAKPGDWIVVQNETNQQGFALKQGRKQDLKTAYIAAPFDAKSTAEVLPFVDLLILNSIEMSQLRKSMPRGPEQSGVTMIVVTEGAAGGVVLRAENGWAEERFESPDVTALDTTGAGDTFAGYFLAALDGGVDAGFAIERAAAAAALMVTKKGTAEAIPSLTEVENFLSQ